VPADRFVQALNEQIGRELGAGQHYLAVAFWYDEQTLPRLAKLFYDQAAEERTHGLMMARYLLDSGVRPALPTLAEPRADFADLVEPVRIALEQERRVTDQIAELSSIAREEGDYVSEQFMQWFLKEQIEEVDLMTSLLAVAERSRDRPMEIEDFIVREGLGGDGEDPAAPPVAGT
jgi:ferritin